MKVCAAALAFLLLMPASQAVAQENKPGTIRGRVTAADTGRPLRRARIMLRFADTEARPLIGPGTNSEGRYELKDVPPGTYYVSASRGGFIELQHGQRRPGERGLAVEVKPGRTTERIDIALPRGSVITGRISDELGEPYPDVRVAAYMLRYDQGRRVPFPIGSGMTDDVGEYRITGLAPGSYFISAASSETWRNEKRETLGYATTYFPGNAPLPQPVTIGLSQERTGIDLTLNASRTARVSGRALRASGQPMAGAQIGVSHTIRGTNYTFSASIAAPVRAAADGSFELPHVPPGDYRIRATDASDNASEYLQVTGDVENLVLVGRSGSTIFGSIVGDDGTPPSFPASGVQVNLIPASDTVLPSVRLFGPMPDWTFRLSGIGGPFYFRLYNAPDDVMIDAVRFNERDLTDLPWDVPTGGRDLATLQIVLTGQIGIIDGTVTTFAGRPTSDATVVVFPEDAAFWTPASRYIKATRPNPEGKFTIRGLPAGDYFIIARDFIEEGQWEDREFLESVRFDAQRVTLRRGGNETVALKLPRVRN
jgi:hypothetical protein